MQQREPYFDLRQNTNDYYCGNNIHPHYKGTSTLLELEDHMYCDCSADHHHHHHQFQKNRTAIVSSTCNGGGFYCDRGVANFAPSKCNSDDYHIPATTTNVPNPINTSRWTSPHLLQYEGVATSHQYVHPWNDHHHTFNNINNNVGCDYHHRNVDRNGWSNSSSGENLINEYQRDLQQCVDYGNSSSSSNNGNNDNIIAEFPCGKKSKPRILFTKDQVDHLERHFHARAYLTSSDRAALSAATNLSPKQVKIWFQNRRYKCKLKGHNNCNPKLFAIPTRTPQDNFF